VTPAEQRNHRIAFARVLSKWSEKGEIDDAARGPLVSRLARLQIVPSGQIDILLGRPDLGPIDLYDSRMWILGPAVNVGTPPFVPVATASIKFDDRWGILVACIRVGLFVGDSLDSLGWRFETPDMGDDPVHPYPHAQPISEWIREFPLGEGRPEADSIKASSTPVRTINERRPAFPLRNANTIAGLAAVTLAALHGAPLVRGWLLEVSRPGVPQEVWTDVNACVARAELQVPGA
jgi:hypothetical protein